MRCFQCRSLAAQVYEKLVDSAGAGAEGRSGRRQIDVDLADQVLDTAGEGDASRL